MSSRLPKVDYQTWTLPVSNNGVNPLRCHDYKALLVSESHYRRRNGSWSGGGPFCVVKRSLIHQQGDKGKIMKSNGQTETQFSAGASGTPTFVPPDISTGAAQGLLRAAQDRGLEGYNRTRPGTNEADLYVSLSELVHDGFPSIPLHGLKGQNPVKSLQDLFKYFRGLGSEYLNVVFGWRPFVNDLRKLYRAMKNIDNMVNKLVAQNGHTVRRRATLVNSHELVQEDASFNAAYAYAYGGSGLPNSFAGAKSVWTRVTTTEEKVWYSSSWRYWIPNPHSWLWRARAKATLFGALPTPGALYAAMPWSWMADWFTNIGEIAKALSPSAVDNLVQRYGYTMRWTRKRVLCLQYTTYPGRNTLKDFGGGTLLGQKWDGADLVTSSLYTEETKTRAGGFNPFGPDKAAGGLSPYQLSVLSALGLTRSG